MSESEARSSGAAPLSAGALLREARQAQGLHIDALAHTIKVASRKLEALEADRFDELPDLTFARALAQTVCRALKIDAAPVMALLPPPRNQRLELLSEGLNTPFRDRPGRLVPRDWTVVTRSAVWAPALLLVAAVAVYWLPSGIFSRVAPAPIAAGSAGIAPAVLPVAATLPAGEATEAAAGVVPSAATAGEAAVLATAAASEASAPLALGATAAEAAAPIPLAAASVATPPAPPPSTSPAAVTESLLQLQASATSWIEVIDAHGKPLLSRLVQPGENVALDGALPLKVKIGNAADTRLVFRGRALELAPFTRDNLARLELK